MKPFARRSVTAFSLAALVGLTACATSPTGRTQLNLVSSSQMAEMGTAAFQELKQKTPVTKSAQTSAYVQCVARSITSEIGGNWEVQVFESKDVNAFALPGGKIGVYTGLLKVAANQDQLAAVIGHEVAHVIAGHSAARASNQMATQYGGALASILGAPAQAVDLGAKAVMVGILLPYSRGDESEADILGQQYMARAGFDPAQAAQLWVSMQARGSEKPPEFMSTHPSDSTRISALQRNQVKVQPLYDQARAAGKRPACKA